MSLEAGTRLSAATSSCEVLVVKPPTEGGPLTCAGCEMAPRPGSSGAQHGQADVQLGKRYLDAVSGLEVLCVKAGAGPLRFADRELVVRVAKTLPASD